MLCIFIALYHCITNLFFLVVSLLFLEGLDYRIIFFIKNFNCLQAFLQIVRIIAIFMWLWFVARQPNSSMLFLALQVLSHRLWLLRTFEHHCRDMT